MATTERRRETSPERAPRPLWQRLGWMVVLWSLSVLALALVAYGIRLLMNAAGLSMP